MNLRTLLNLSFRNYVVTSNSLCRVNNLFAKVSDQMNEVKVNKNILNVHNSELKRKVSKTNVDISVISKSSQEDLIGILKRCRCNNWPVLAGGPGGDGPLRIIQEITDTISCGEGSLLNFSRASRLFLY